MSHVDMMGDLPFAPQANPDAVAKLKQIDERLEMKYLPIGQGTWAIIERWGQNDPRRQKIQLGEHRPDADFDVIGYAPEDAGLEDAMDMLLQKLRGKAKDDPEKYGGMLNNLLVMNKLQQQQNLQETRDFITEMLDANEERLGTKVVSRGAGFNIENGKVVGTPVKQRMGLNKSEREAREEMTDK